MTSRSSIIITSAGAVREDAAPRYRLTTRVIGLMLMLSLIPLLAFGALALRQEERQARASSEALMTQGAGGISAQVNDWIDENVRTLQTAARLPAVTSMAAGSQEGALKAIQETHPWMYLVFTVGMDGKSVARSDGKPNADYSDRLYFSDVALLGKAFSWQTLVGKTSGRPTLVMAVPIVVNGNRVGVVAAAMTTEELSRTVATWRTGSTGFAYLLDEQRRVISHPNKDLVASMADLHGHPVVQAPQGVGAGPRLISYNGVDHQPALGLAMTNKYGWMLGVEQSEDEVLGEMRQARLIGLAFLLVSTIVVGVIAWRTALSLVRPIVQLTEMADRMSTGETNVQLDIRSNDEIGQLAKSFLRMQTSLRRAMERLGSSPSIPTSRGT